MLIQCLECKKEVSDQDEFCPDCGFKGDQRAYAVNYAGKDTGKKGSEDLQKNPVYVVLLVILLSFVALSVFLLRRILLM
ncbi:hypothetical protein [Bdellovibrio sp. HCB274]|uniref:hypothetical protein n=1 Tax=Bdellovibrio sp. HCB274 TaxID=3394361 RepID=UPI0039B6A67E